MLPEEIFPGVKQLIEKLKFIGVKVALASSSKNARTVIRRLQIENMFEVVVDGTMIIRTKPDPEIFLRTAQLIEILPDNCLVFEDAEAGVEAALAAGMKCVGVGSIQQLRKANMVIDKTGDFRTEMLIGF
jgi:beta-phosphoglucomutase